MFVAAFGTNVPTPLLLIYRDALGLSSTALTGAFGVYAAGLVPALLLAGPASDRFGRRAVVVPFVLLSAAHLAAVPRRGLLGAAAVLLPVPAGRGVRGGVQRGHGLAGRADRRAGAARPG